MEDFGAISVLVNLRWEKIQGVAWWLSGLAFELGAGMNRLIRAIIWFFLLLSILVVGPALVGIRNLANSSIFVYDPNKEATAVETKGDTSIVEQKFFGARRTIVYESRRRIVYEGPPPLIFTSTAVTCTVLVGSPLGLLQCESSIDTIIPLSRRESELLNRGAGPESIDWPRSRFPEFMRPAYDVVIPKRVLWHRLTMMLVVCAVLAYVASRIEFGVKSRRSDG